MALHAHPAPGPAETTQHLAALAAQHATAADTERRLAPDVVAALVDAGFARHFVPAAHGGTAGSFTALAEAVRTIARGCPSAGWTAVIMATSARLAGQLPQAGRKEIWGQSADVPIAAALNPGGSVRRVADGWVLSGQWFSLSGIDHAAWALLCVTAPEDGEQHYCAVPADRFRIEDTWFTLGMRGTGSRSAVLDEVFVPGHLSAPRDLVWQGRADGPADALAAPLPAAHPPLFAAPVVGAARAALDLWARTESRTGPDRDAVLTRSAAEIDTAALLVEQACLRLDGRGPAGGPDTARNGRDAALAADLARTATDRLFRSRGSRAHAAKDPVQRLWRDVQTASSHAAVDAGRSNSLFATTFRASLPNHEES
ncbi:acyl-CoA dehydrogenase family protein [Streptomyces sp. NPDC053720]|uniref:acyl-CoA dehydrogenase family protein n=1 Tax=Streptomyces sp. NPDC053720 TaxID=3154855 RepID=UPI00342CEC38